MNFNTINDKAAYDNLFYDLMRYLEERHGQPSTRPYDDSVGNATIAIGFNILLICFFININNIF